MKANGAATGDLARLLEGSRFDRGGGRTAATDRTKPADQVRNHRIVREILAEIDRRGISQRRFAREVGYSHRSLENWRAGLRFGRLTLVDDYVAALGGELLAIWPGRCLAGDCPGFGR